MSRAELGEHAGSIDRIGQHSSSDWQVGLDGGPHLMGSNKFAAERSDLLEPLDLNQSIGTKHLYHVEVEWQRVVDHGARSWTESRR